MDIAYKNTWFYWKLLFLFLIVNLKQFIAIVQFWDISQTNNNKPCHIFYIILLFLLSQGIPGLPGIAGLNGQKVISCQGYSFIM